MQLFRQKLAQDIAKALPACFPETIHAVIARSVQPALEGVFFERVMQGVRMAFYPLAEQVERAIRPLAEEVARLRRSIEADSEKDDWWKRGRDPEQEPDPEGGENA